MLRNGKATILILAALCTAGCAHSDFAARRQQSQTRQGLAAQRGKKIAPVAEPKILPETYFAAGQLFEQQGQTGKAIAQYRKAVAVNHRFVAAYHRLGVLLSSLGRNAEAVEALSHAVELAPDEALIRNNFGYALMLERRWADAEREFVAALKLQPRFPRAHVNLGMVQARMGRFEESLASFKNVLAEPDAYYNIGLLLRAQQRYDEAAEAFHHTLELSPDFRAAETQLAQIRDHLTPAPPVMDQLDRTAKADAPPVLEVVPAFTERIAPPEAGDPVLVAAVESGLAYEEDGFADGPARPDMVFTAPGMAERTFANDSWIVPSAVVEPPMGPPATLGHDPRVSLEMPATVPTVRSPIERNESSEATQRTPEKQTEAVVAEIPVGVEFSASQREVIIAAMAKAMEYFPNELYCWDGISWELWEEHELAATEQRETLATVAPLSADAPTTTVFPANERLFDEEGNPCNVADVLTEAVVQVGRSIIEEPELVAKSVGTPPIDTTKPKVFLTNEQLPDTEDDPCAEEEASIEAVVEFGPPVAEATVSERELPSSPAPAVEVVQQPKRMDRGAMMRTLETQLAAVRQEIECWDEVLVERAETRSVLPVGRRHVQLTSERIIDVDLEPAPPLPPLDPFTMDLLLNVPFLPAAPRPTSAKTVDHKEPQENKLPRKPFLVREELPAPAKDHVDSRRGEPAIEFAPFDWQSTFGDLEDWISIAENEIRCVEDTHALP
ncbi:MAG: tetratricopeptide repeat protein [Planctomycetes bacterium]|nr:tetratricopeptide repeat protein [Planctomycetota bacterium]